MRRGHWENEEADDNMARGNSVPQLHSVIGSSRRLGHSDCKKMRRTRCLPPIMRAENYKNRQSVTMADTHDIYKINRSIIDNALVRESPNTITDNRQQVLTASELRVKRMFNLMSMEAREAYSQTMKEMSAEEIQAGNPNKNCASTELLENPVSTEQQIYSSTTSSRSANVGDTHLDLHVSQDSRQLSHRGHQTSRPAHLPQIVNLHRVSKSEPTHRSRRKKKLPNPFLTKTMPPLTTCRAPISHTAARIGRKNKETVQDVESELSDSSINRLAPANIVRPFEITPIGYDCRYSRIQNALQYNTDEDEDLASYVIQKATDKCNNWLASQRDPT